MDFWQGRDVLGTLASSPSVSCFWGPGIQNKIWFDTWKTLDHDPKVEEVIRNLPIRNPIIWLDKESR